MSVKYCSECGTQAGTLAKFCSGCGHGFVSLAAKTGPTSRTPQRQASPLEEEAPRTWNLDRSGVSVEVFNDKVTAAQICSMPPSGLPQRLDKKTLKNFKLPSREDFLAQSMAECGSARNTPTEIVSAEE